MSDTAVTMDYIGLVDALDFKTLKTTENWNFWMQTRAHNALRKRATEMANGSGGARRTQLGSYFHLLNIIYTSTLLAIKFEQIGSTVCFNNAGRSGLRQSSSSGVKHSREFVFREFGGCAGHPRRRPGGEDRRRGGEQAS